jgi:hypothetical protein
MHARPDFSLVEASLFWIQPRPIKNDCMQLTFQWAGDLFSFIHSELQNFLRILSTLVLRIIRGKIFLCFVP